MVFSPLLPKRRGGRSKLLMISDEAGMLSNFNGKYNGGIPNLDLLLKSWNGEKYICNRVIRGRTEIPRPYLSVALAGQPYIWDNPCKRVTVPKGEKKEKDIYTLEEVAQLFQLLETAPLKYRTFFTLAIYSGFRRGEMLGLEWKDIDWDNCVISVRRTSNYTASKGIYTDTTKTKKSQRSLKFPQSVMDLLREYKAEQDEERIKLGTKWQDYDRLFVKWDGRPMNNNTPYFWLKEFCEENKFRFCDIHSLRHFYASALINEGVDAATVSGALGHSTITTTTSIYCHVFNQAQARAGDAIASVLDFKKHDTDKGQPEAV